MVWWLRQRTHNWVVKGSNPGTIYWMVEATASYYNDEKISHKWGTRIFLKLTVILA